MCVCVSLGRAVLYFSLLLWNVMQDPEAQPAQSASLEDTLDVVLVPAQHTACMYGWAIVWLARSLSFTHLSPVAPKLALVLQSCQPKVIELKFP